MKRKFSKEAIIGLVTIVSLAFLYIGVNFLKGINMFKPSNYYYISCTNVRDINISTPVFVEGFKVGLVRSIEYDYSSTNKITLEVSLDKGMRINKGSYVSIESTLLSGAELHIILNKYVTEYLKPGDTVEGRMKVGMVTSVEERVMPTLEEMLPKIDSILAGLQTLVNSAALYNTLENLESATKQLDVSSHRLNNLLATDLPVIADNLKTASVNLSTFSADINKLNLEQSVTSLNSTLDNFDSMSKRLNAKDNSLGLLLNDSTLYNNLNRTLDNASGLIIDFKQNPKRYINFSLF
ncbi:MAG: MlaD family protein [Tannerella sp.]|nr:MlaD family protein [Tannerella sp.]